MNKLLLASSLALILTACGGDDKTADATTDSVATETKTSLTDKAASAVSGFAGSATDKAKEMAASASGAVADKAKDVTAAVAENAKEMANGISDHVPALKEMTDKAVDSVGEKANSLIDKAAGMTKTDKPAE